MSSAGAVLEDKKMTEVKVVLGLAAGCIMPRIVMPAPSVGALLIWSVYH
jgi:hypothetical protein